MASSGVISVLDIVKIDNLFCNMKLCDTEGRETDRNTQKSG